MRKKRSAIWMISDEKLKELVSKNTTLSGILNDLGLNSKGSQHKTLKTRLKASEIQIPYRLGLGANKGRKFFRRKVPLEKILVKNSSFARGHLKKRLLSENILENKCNHCGQLPEWNNKNLVLILDHINGISNDHRRENLQLLCPNCNSQTETFAGRNSKYKTMSWKDMRDEDFQNRNNIKIVFNCENCGEKRSRNSVNKLCKKCFNKTRRKTERPSLELLKNEIKEFGYSAVGRKYNVSDNAIRKWIK